VVARIARTRRGQYATDRAIQPTTVAEPRGGMKGMGGVLRRSFAFAVVATLAACAPTTTPAWTTPSRPTDPPIGYDCAVALARAKAAGAKTARADVPAGTTLTIFHETHTDNVYVRPDGVTFAHYAGLVKALRASLPDPSHSLFVGNGDDVGSDLCGVSTNGSHAVAALSAAGIDANTFGMDELSHAPSSLRDVVKASSFMWVSANARDEGGGESSAAAGAKRWIIKDVGGVRVGVTGVATPDPTGRGSGFRFPGYDVLDPVRALRAAVPLMRKDGAEIVVVLSHLHREEIVRVASEVEGVDVVLGWHVGRPGESFEIGQTIVASGFNKLGELGQLDLTVRGGRIVAHRAIRHIVTANAPADVAVADALAKHLRR
jgi:2',3'-cyclic-nucleotide 2'-phosphodiesterase/3'-nucleotidase